MEYITGYFKHIFEGYKHIIGYVVDLSQMGGSCARGGGLPAPTISSALKITLSHLAVAVAVVVTTKQTNKQSSNKQTTKETNEQTTKETKVREVKGRERLMGLTTSPHQY